jgi:uncharacterized membrane protein SirB2
MVIAAITAWWQPVLAVVIAYIFLWVITLIARAHDERRVQFIYIALVLLPLAVISLVAIS